MAIFVSAGCKKEVTGSSTIPPPPDSTQQTTSILNLISKSWKLVVYTIHTDKVDYRFGESQVTGHALRTLDFNTNETYQAADTMWSGTFQFYQDSAQVLLTPFDQDEIPCMLSIDALTDTSVHFSSPQVTVNPQSSNATSYQQFVAYEALTFLSLNGINSDSNRTVKIEFDYYMDYSN